jgi:hypothetical protein
LPIGQPFLDAEQKHRLGGAAVAHRRHPAEQSHDAVGHQRRVAANEIDEGMRARGGRTDQTSVRQIAAGLRVDGFAGSVDQQDEIMVAQGAEPGAQARLHHRRQLVDVVGADRGVGLDDVLEPEQRPFAVIDDGAAEQLPFALESDVVGALC